MSNTYKTSFIVFPPKHLSPQLKKAIELEVRLREQLAANWLQGGDGLLLPPSSALLGTLKLGGGGLNIEACFIERLYYWLSSMKRRDFHASSMAI